MWQAARAAQSLQAADQLAGGHRQHLPMGVSQIECGLPRVAHVVTVTNQVEQGVGLGRQLHGQRVQRGCAGRLRQVGQQIVRDRPQSAAHPSHSRGHIEGIHPVALQAGRADSHDQRPQVAPSDGGKTAVGRAGQVEGERGSLAEHQRLPAPVEGRVQPFPAPLLESFILDKEQHAQIVAAAGQSAHERVLHRGLEQRLTQHLPIGCCAGLAAQRRLVGLQSAFASYRQAARLLELGDDRPAVSLLALDGDLEGVQDGLRLLAMLSGAATGGRRTDFTPGPTRPSAPPPRPPGVPAPRAWPGADPGARPALRLPICSPRPARPRETG